MLIRKTLLTLSYKILENMLKNIQQKPIKTPMKQLNLFMIK